MPFLDEYLDHLVICIEDMENAIDRTRQGRLGHQALWDLLSEQTSLMAHVINRADRELSDEEEDDLQEAPERADDPLDELSP